MKYRYVFFPILLLFITLGCKKDGPVSSESLGPFLYGTVVDAQGNPVDSVAFHYIFTMDPSGLGKIAKTCPSTPITCTLPQKSYVRLNVYRWFTREYIATLIDDTLDAGMYSFNSSPSTLTNGVYIYSLAINGTVQEKTMKILNPDYATLVQTNPLAVSDSAGNFSIPIGVFGLGVPFEQSSIGGDTVITAYISPIITAVLYKSGQQITTKSVAIEASQNMTEQFQFGQ